ncbi:MAG: 23S rRNA (uracil(1939)-C(5))-methyltransferase RlmD [Lachnospiraceae bacterium]|nr:23S rRNA (uracil(1939)-C(5))-methyltransferase RlmD [Lachnospiraceae bacterium]
MKKGQIYEGTVKRVDFPNKGVIEIEGEKVVVKNCMPGQKISFAINKIRSEKSEGKRMEVLEKSPLETRKKACRSFGDCGGCSYQTMAYEHQLEMKEGQVKRLVDQVCKDYTFEEILGSPGEWGYRNKMEFSFGDEFKNGPLALGLHKKGSFHDIITADDCVIVDKDFNQILSCVLKYCSDIGADYFHKLSHKGYLRHLLVRKAVKTGEILINIVTTSQEEGFYANQKNMDMNATINPTVDQHGTDYENNQKTGREIDQEIGREINQEISHEISHELDYENLQVEDRVDIFVPLVEQLLQLNLNGTIAGILHTYNNSQADVIKNDRTVLLHGRDYIYEELLGLTFKISTFSFFQTNSLGAEVLYSKVREYVGETRDKSIFDLYSGTGTIAQLLAPVASKVTGVEIVEEAVEAAKENAAQNGLNNCEFIAGDVLKVIDSLKEKPDIIVLDPPRDGIHPKALDKIINFGVDRIVYISCKPTSLVRDLEVLQAKGYKVEKVCTVDMFPETVHCESICLLQRK